MFTGIIQDLVKIDAVKQIFLPDVYNTDINDKNRADTEITLNLKKFKKLKIGDSVAINGVCLTVAKLNKNPATFQLLMKLLEKLFFLYQKRRLSKYRRKFEGGRQA